MVMTTRDLITEIMTEKISHTAVDATNEQRKHLLYEKRREKKEAQ